MVKPFAPVVVGSDVELVDDKTITHAEGLDVSVYEQRPIERPPSEQIRYINAGAISPLKIAAQYELDRHVEWDDLTIVTHWSDRPALMYYGFYPADEYMDFDKVSIPEVRLSAPLYNAPMFMDDGLVLVDVHYDSTEDQTKLHDSMIRAVTEVLGKAGVKVFSKENPYKLYFRDKDREVKFFSTAFVDGHYYFYINFDTEYNETVRPLLREGQELETSDEFAYGLSAVADLDKSIVDNIISVFAGNYGLPIQESDYTDEEEQIIESLYPVHQDTEWIRNAERIDVWFANADRGVEEGTQLDIYLHEKQEFVEIDLPNEGVEFHYQPELPPSKEGFRPPHVVGSLAVYEPDGRTKRGHIFRAWIEDISSGKRAWCDWDTDNDPALTKKLVLKIPQDFLDSTTGELGYLIDPTFGYTTIPATTQNVADAPRGSLFTFPSIDNAVATTIWIYATGGTYGAQLEGAIYSGTTLVAQSSNLSAVGNAWYSMTITAPLVSGTTYALVAWGANAGGYNVATAFFDTVGGVTGKTDTKTYVADAWDNPITWGADDANRSYGIYLDYDVGINVSDSITVTESRSVNQAFSPTKSDSITVTESVKVQVVSAVSQSDSVTVTESVTIAPPLTQIVKSENITVTENVKMQVISTINKSDSITLNEALALENVLNLTVSESITVTEARQQFIQVAIGMLSPAHGTPYATSPDSPRLAGIGDSDIIVRLAMDDWGVPGNYLNKWAGSGQQSFNLRNAPTSKRLIFNFFLAPATLVQALSDSGPPVANNTPIWLRVTRNATTGDVTFYYAADQLAIPTSWTQIGAVYSGTAGAIRDSTAALEIGTENAGAGFVVRGVTYRVIVKNGSVTVADFDPTNARALTDTSVDAWTGEIYSLNSPAEFIGFLPPYVSVSDSVTVSENVQVEVTTGALSINVSDSVTVSESLTVRGTSVVSPSDSVTVSETLTARLTSVVTTSDSVTVSESLSVRETSFVAVSDSITVSESLYLLIPTLFLSVSDSIIVSEALTLQSQDGVAVMESISVTENAQLSLSAPQIAVSDSITVTESVTTRVTAFVNVNDAVTVSENVSIQITSSISVSDSVTVTESLKEQVISFVTGSESITVSESVSVAVIALGALAINVSDSITVSESLSLLVPTLFVAVSDSIAVTEAVQRQVSSFITVSDSITVSESVSVSAPTSTISVSDSVNITESLTVRETSFIAVSESVTVSESVQLSVTSTVSVSDSITLSELVKSQVGSFISTSESITLSESVQVANALFINVSDSVTVSEAFILQSAFLVSVVDNITVTDSPIVAPPLSQISASDSVSVGENVQVSVPVIGVITINVSDSITVSESVANEVASFINVNDSIILTESIPKPRVADVRYNIGAITWDGTAGSKWSYTSGGSTGAPIPTTTTDVYLEGAVTVTAGTTISYLSLRCDNFAGGTFAQGTQTMNVGSGRAPADDIALKFISGMTYTRFSDFTAAVNFVSTYPGQVGVDFGGKQVSQVNFNGVGGSWLVNGNVSQNGPSGTTFIFTNGTLEFGTVTANGINFRSTSTNVRTLRLGGALIIPNIGGTQWDVNPTNLTFDRGTSTIRMGRTNDTKVFKGAGLTYYDVRFENLTGSSFEEIQGANTFHDLYKQGNSTNGNTGYLQLAADQVVTNLFTLAGISATARTILKSTVPGTQRKISAATIAVQYVNVKDSDADGVAAPFSGTSIGDLGNNTDWIFDFFMVPVSDSISVTDTPSLELQTQVNTSETVSVTENVQIGVGLEINVSDSILISEVVQVTPSTNISVSDSVTVSENVQTLLLTGALAINVSDSISVSEAVNTTTATDAVASDSITVSELTVPRITSFISVTDQITVTETVNVRQGALAITVSESVTVSESIQRQLTSQISVTQSITVSESKSVSVTSFVNRSETITVNESVTLVPSGIPAANISVSDLITVTENVQVAFPTDLRYYLESQEPDATQDSSEPSTALSSQEPSNAVSSAPSTTLISREPGSNLTNTELGE